MSSTPYLRHQIVVRDQIHALVASLPEIEHSVRIEYEAGWPPEPVWAFSKRKITSCYRKSNCQSSIPQSCLATSRQTVLIMQLPVFVPINYTYLLTYSMEQSLSSEANRVCSQSRNFPHFMEHESSLPYSQVPATWVYPAPTPSSLHPLPLPEDPS